MVDRQKYKHRNYVEAAICGIIADNLIQCGVEKEKLAVFTPFREQTQLLKEHLKQFGVTKVVSFERCLTLQPEIALISCSKWTADDGVSLYDFKKINQAITRASTKLIIIGSE